MNTTTATVMSKTENFDNEEGAVTFENVELDLDNFDESHFLDEHEELLESDVDESNLYDDNYEDYNDEFVDILPALKDGDSYF